LHKAGSSADQESRATADKQLISLSWTSSTVTSLSIILFRFAAIDNVP
jgi:hypothetical protein